MKKNPHLFHERRGTIHDGSIEIMPRFIVLHHIFSYKIRIYRYHILLYKIVYFKVRDKI